MRALLELMSKGARERQVLKKRGWMEEMVNLEAGLNARTEIYSMHQCSKVRGGFVSQHQLAS